MDYILLAVLAVMVLLLINQNRKRKKDAVKLLESLAIGAEVTLHSGIKGIITEVSDIDVVIESTPGTKLRVIKQAVRVSQPATGEGK